MYHNTCRTFTSYMPSDQNYVKFTFRARKEQLSTVNVTRVKRMMYLAAFDKVLQLEFSGGVTCPMYSVIIILSVDVYE